MLLLEGGAFFFLISKSKAPDIHSQIPSGFECDSSESGCVRGTGMNASKIPLPGYSGYFRRYYKCDWHLRYTCVAWSVNMWQGL